MRCAALTQRLGSDGGLWGSATGIHPAPPEVKQGPLSAPLGAGKGVLAARNFLRTFSPRGAGREAVSPQVSGPGPRTSISSRPHGLGPHAVCLYNYGALITRHRGQAAPRGLSPPSPPAARRQRPGPAAPPGGRPRPRPGGAALRGPRGSLQPAQDTGREGRKGGRRV